MIDKLCRLAKIDDGEDPELKKYIDDFQSSYIGRNGRRGNSEWAIVGERIKYIMELVFLYKSELK